MYSLMLVVAIAAVTFAAFMYYAERGSYNIVTGNWERPYGWR